MKELSVEEKAKRYDDAKERMKDFLKEWENCGAVGEAMEKARNVFSELKESEDERVRKALINGFNKLDKSAVWYNGITNAQILAWLEKQVSVDEDEIVKGIRRGVAISLINHIDANSKGMCLSNMECEDIENAIVNEDWDKVYGYMKKKLEKQGEQKPQGKSALEAANKERVDNANKVEPKDYSSIDPHFFKPADKIKSKFKVKYAGGEYNVLEVKDIAGVTYYGIEDEPNHIDYVLPDNCETVSEQKHADKVNPKFRNGQWIVWQDKCYKVNYNGCGYELVDQNGLSTSLEYGTIDENAHIWDITKDAKDGDVLVAENGWTCIFKELKGENFSSFCFMDSGCYFHEGSECHTTDERICGKMYPATKEQRNTLMKAMADARYTFDFVKKELKKM